ncbi:MAG: hypothetical protein ACR2PL_09960 [Dehalococcoidia bacterium]
MNLQKFEGQSRELTGRDPAVDDSGTPTLVVLVAQMVEVMEELCRWAREKQASDEAMRHQQETFAAGLADLEQRFERQNRQREEGKQASAVLDDLQRRVGDLARQTMVAVAHVPGVEANEQKTSNDGEQRPPEPPSAPPPPSSGGSTAADTLVQHPASSTITQIESADPPQTDHPEVSHSTELSVVDKFLMLRLNHLGAPVDADKLRQQLQLLPSVMQLGAPEAANDSVAFVVRLWPARRTAFENELAGLSAPRFSNIRFEDGAIVADLAPPASASGQSPRAASRPARQGPPATWSHRLLRRPQ